MPDFKQFRLPDVGEGLTEADILSWSVAVGDTVVVNQILVEVETAKAAVELPSPFAGTVTELLVKAGQTVEVGRPIISIDVDPSGTPAPAGPAAADPASADPASADPASADPQAAWPPEPAVTGPGAVNGRQPVLVGYGPRSGPATRRRRRPAPDTPAGPSVHGAFSVPPAPQPPAPPAAPQQSTAPQPDGAEPARVAVLAKPPVRKLARSLGVDLATVVATGPHGSISRDDVRNAGTAPAPDATPDQAQHPAPAGRETRIPIRGVRKHTAAAMVASAFTAPHVTEFVTVDVTETVALRDRVAARREFRGVKLTMLTFVARAVLRALARTPEVNASWDEAGGQIVLKHYVNLGIAAATDRGLVVPNVKDADRLDLLGLATALADLAETARAGRTAPADMAGGTFTITNVGVFGVDTGTPILNPGEAGILALGAVRRMPWVVAGADGSEALVPRWVTQLALSFDHRLVDGQQGSRVLADIAAVLNDPGLALL